MLSAQLLVGFCVVLGATPAADPAVLQQLPRAQPFDPPPLHRAASFRASDSLIEGPWIRALEGIEHRRQTGFFDDLYAPKGPFWGDARVLTRAHLWLSNDETLNRAALSTVFHPRFASDGAVRPAEHLPLAEYSLLWPAMLDDFFRHTGDREYAKALAATVLPRLFEYYGRFETRTGLLRGTGPIKAFGEWPEPLRRGFDYDHAARRPNAVLNAFYFNALDTAARLSEALGLPHAEYRDRAETVRRAFQAKLLDARTGLFRDSPRSQSQSLVGNALALCFGLVDEANVPAVLALIRQRGADCARDFAPYVIEACFKAGAPQLGYDMITFTNDSSWNSSPIYLIAEYVAGLRPTEPGWRRLAAAPRFPSVTGAAHLTVPIPGGRVTIRYEPGVSTTLTVPPGVRVEATAREGETIMVKTALSHAVGTITEAQWERLEAEGWSARVADAAAIWVSVGEQMLRFIEDGEVLFQARCASSAKGLGAQMDSLQTPQGWHSIVRKVGDDAPWGQVFRSRRPTRTRWQPGDDTTEDLVLSRILLLTGEEPGKNKGGDVDSYARNIYIHGTNDEARIGTPSSHGCIRLTNDDVIDAYNRIPAGALVLITEF